MGKVLICVVTTVVFMLVLFHRVEALPIGLPPNLDVIKLNTSMLQRLSWSYMGQNLSSHCVVRPTDKGIHQVVNNALEFSKLIEYHMTVKGYKVNPLEVNNTWNYKPQNWARVASSHGQTILNLAFNYGVLSLMTLSFGIVKLDVELEDIPYGCLGNLTEDEKILVVMDIVLRDLNEKGDIVVFEGQSSVCHQFIKQVSGMAKFTDRCCYEPTDSKSVECLADLPNKWLSILDILLGTLTICVFIFGPMLMPDWIYTAAMDTMDYYVKLKEPLYKKLAVCRRDIAQDIDADHVVDLRNRRDFEKCRRIVAELPGEHVIPIKISQFDIKVNYRKLLVENSVPVGMIDSLSRAIFMCKIRELDAFSDCCDANITGCVKTGHTKETQWIDICNLFGRILLVLFLPTPFYIRLIVYYIFENPEIMDRHEAADKVGLVMYYNYRLMQFLTPTHPIYITIYVIYFLSGFTIAYFSGTDKKTRFQQAIMDAFSDLKSLSMLKAFEMLISNCLWPFKKYGIFGLFIGIIFWPLLLPVSIIACSIYCLPLIFVSCRIFLHTFNGQVENRRERFKPTPQHFQADNVLKRLNSRTTRKAARETCFYCSPNVRRWFLNLFLAGMATLTMYAAMLVLSEIVTFVAEIMSFTMMGIIVNASTVLKYGTLLFLVVLYSYDCYSNVNKKYLKLNKAIFSEIKYRLGKDIEQFTQLPSHIQENRGFKSAEASEQAEYESIDDISYDIPFHWDINDLILFIDKEDTPRIPKKLFEDVCQINVAGAPGPVYKSLIDATRKFLIIILFLAFVFIVVLSFGESYNMSSTNQMLATMAGGFAPFMFRNVFKPGKADVETGLLSFKSKLEEIIKNFCQPWPMYEFVFDIEEEPKSDEEEEEEEDSENKSETSEGDKQDSNCLQSDQKPEKDNNGNEKVSEKPENLSEQPIELVLLAKDPLTPCFLDMGKTEKGSTGNSKKEKKDDKDKTGKDKEKNGKDKNSKDKDKNGKDKKGGGIDWLTLIMRTKSVAVNEIKEKLDTMVLEPAEGNKVDILIYVGESDQEWNYEESVTDYAENEDDLDSEFFPKENGTIPKSNYISLNNLNKL